jgi:hypothetical protein
MHDFKIIVSSASPSKPEKGECVSQLIVAIMTHLVN